MGEIKPAIETFAKIKVIGIGGGGSSAINRMIKAGIKGVDFMAVNTDVQALNYSLAPQKVHVGRTITKGLGAGMEPDMGRKSAEENQNEIREALVGSDMVFITCGLGGGTGTGAAPVIASLARDIGALTVAVVSKPFTFEGAQRKTIAERGYDELASKVDTIITIPNDRIFQIIDKNTSVLDAFEIVDDVLRQGVQGISEIITVPGLINVDFADVKAIMKETGSALMGIGQASGENRAIEAAEYAISSPLLELAIDGARGILFTITGGPDLGMHEINDAAKVITESADADAKVIFGAIINEDMGEEVKITVVATGFEDGDNYAKDIIDKERSIYTPNHFIKEKTRESGMSSLAKAAAVTFSKSRKAKQETANKQAEEEANAEAAKKEEFYMEDEDMEEESATIEIDETNDDEQHNMPAQDESEDLDIPAFIRKKMK